MTDQAPIIETHRLGDADAQEVERQAGCLVAEITGKPPMIKPVSVGSFKDACGTAAVLARRHPGHTFAVFKPAITYTLQPTQPEAPV